MIRTYGKIRILGKNYERLTILKELIIDQSKRIPSCYSTCASKRNIYIRSPSTSMSSNKSNYDLCPVCGENKVGYCTVELTDKKDGPTASGYRYVCGTVLILGAVVDNNAQADYLTQLYIGQRPAVPLIMDRRCIGSLVQVDDVI